jgi:hypothetical protein
MNAEDVDFLIELGDIKDQDETPEEANTLSYLEAIEDVFQGFDGPTYHVIGNHDVDSIWKVDYLEGVENTGIDPSRSYYSFDINGLHCIVLDANYEKVNDDVYNEYDMLMNNISFDWTNTYIPPDELAWLEADLAATTNPTIVFIHQMLAGSEYLPYKWYHLVKNDNDVEGPEEMHVLPILESAPHKVLAVFQGHHHDGDYVEINGIHYYTLKALVEGSYYDDGNKIQENNSYAIVEVHPDRSITVTGYGGAQSVELESNFDLVAIDIKPGSCPNPLNVNSKGVLPVTILGSEDIDVFNIDPASIRLEGVAPISSSYEDVATPVLDSEDECECTTEGPDGYLDLTLKFETHEIVAAIGGASDGDLLLLILTGEYVDETQIVGMDCVIIIAKKDKEK